jgi:hypothetical protein
MQQGRLAVQRWASSKNDHGVGTSIPQTSIELVAALGRWQLPTPTR